VIRQIRVSKINLQRTQHPDILLLIADWQPRALIRAQLLEEGYDVLAVDAWPDARAYLLSPADKPILTIVDLKALDNAEAVLNDVGKLVDRGKVLVLTALGTMTPPQVERLGFHALARPIAVRDVASTAARILRGGRSRHP
jgi:hypothetical protein